MNIVFKACNTIDGKHTYKINKPQWIIYDEM